MITEDAGSLGFDQDRLSLIGDVINKDIQKNTYDGAVIAISRGGMTAALGAFGFADRASKREMKTDDVFVSFSIAKQLTTVMALNRVERGDLALTGKVADIIPEFGNRGKENITLYHLLTHTAGLMFGPPPVDPLQMGDLETVVAAVCASPVESVPGSRVHYSALVAHAIIAEMVRRVDGGNSSFRDIMAREIFDPLQMKDTALGKREDLAARVCPVVSRFQTSGLFEPESVEGMGVLLNAESEIPAGGYVTTAEDMNIFANMLANGGEWQGVRILSPAMINLAIENHTGDTENDIWSYTNGMRGWDMFPAYLGLGFFLRGEGVFPAPFGTLASPDTFGGLGAGSTMFWIDPDKDLTCVFLSTGLMEESYNIERFQRISDLVHAAVTS
jgi:CubicO group peptidase (beta-lactamase class C family)